MMRDMGLGLAALLLAACGGGSGGDFSDDSRMDGAPSAPMMAQMEKAEFRSEGGMTEPTPAPDTNPGEPGAEQYIAYSYNLGLTLPKGQVEPVMLVHTKACHSAGTATCIVINSNVYSQDQDYASGNLSIRATPDWIETFMIEIETDADKAGGEITQRSRRSDDLTRQIIDTGARMEAQVTLQGRLMGLLERRDGDLGDLLQIERELARVTGDIESIRAQLKTLRLRVSMSSLDLNYQTKQAINGARDNPLGQAFGGFFYNMAAAFASVVTAFAIGLPWMILIGGLLWIWLRLIWPWVRRKRVKKS